MPGMLLKDSGGTAWNVDFLPSGNYQSRSLGIVPSAPTSLLVNDFVLPSATWSITISVGGAPISVTSVAFSPGTPTVIPGSNGFAFVVDNGALGSISFSLSNIYQYVTYAALRQELANRLYDANKVFWSDAELKLYVIEALRTWNALTSLWRGDFLFTSQAGTVWYDMTNPAQMLNSLRAQTALDTDLYTLIAYHLLEPPIGVAPWTWAGSTQFTADDLINATARRRDEVLSTTRCQLTRRLVGAVAGRTLFPDTVIDVRRVAYLPAAQVFGPYGIARVLFPEDSWAERAFNRNYLQAPAGLPSAYLMSTQPPISFDTDVPPGGGGQYECLTVEAGGALSTASASSLSIPDDWIYVIKWGVLADLLGRDSLARDPLRQQYAEQRYRMGLKLLEDAPALLTMRIGNVPMWTDSVREADLFNTNWQGANQATPTTALQAGLNLIALSPTPDLSTYSLTATVVQNAPLPAVDNDFVQVARDDYDAVLDYCVHLAMFKSGGAEFTSTMPLLARFLKQASIYNSKLSELGEFTIPLFGVSQREASINPVLDPAVIADEGSST